MGFQKIITEETLWVAHGKLHARLKEQFRQAESRKNLWALGAMVPCLRQLYWISSFLGLSELAAMSAAMAVFIGQKQQICSKYSMEISTVVHSFLNTAFNFHEPGTSTQLSQNNSPEIKMYEPLNAKELRTIMGKNLIAINQTSYDHPICIKDPKSPNNLVNIPASAMRRHNPENNMFMVHLDLQNQPNDLDGLVKALENFFKSKELILNGLLKIQPYSDNVTYNGLHFYLIIDTNSSAREWLQHADLKGRVVNVLKNPNNDNDQTIQTESLHVSSNIEMRDKPMMQKNPAKPAKINMEPQDPISFDSEGIKELEPFKKEGSLSKYDKKRKIKNRDLKIRIPVGVKLQVIVSFIIIVSMLSLTMVSLYLFRSEFGNLIDDTNISFSNLIARQTESEVLQAMDSANLIFQFAYASDGAEGLIDDFFNNYKSLVYVGIPTSGIGYTNRLWFQQNRITDATTTIQNIVSFQDANWLERVAAGETSIINVTPMILSAGSPILAIATPFILAGESSALLILADIGNTLEESVQNQEGYHTTMIINSNGDILAHPDYEKVSGGSTITGTPVFEQMYAQSAQKGQVKYTIDTEEGPKTYIGSFSIIPTGNLGVVSTVEEANAFQSVYRIQFLSMTLLGTILSLSILGVFFFSISLSNPLKELTLATRKIKAKNYAISIKPRSADEVGQLTRHFLGMIPELEKVDRLQARTSKFVNPQVANMIAENALPESAETKDITVFFSDVRNFTAIAESMADPQLVLDNLSEYFRTVVPCIERTDGTVDKFIGDAVMAVWGSMKDLDNHAESAINGALKIRMALMEFNQSRGGPTCPKFQTGCGLNSGMATVGMMGGGSAKEEWAHIGDTVNLASRLEELNKPMGTDILISQNTADKVKGIFHLVPMSKIKVKGKAKPQQIYAVLGRMDDDTRPKTLAQLRTILEIKGNFSKATVIKEENEIKYEILNS